MSRKLAVLTLALGLVGCGTEEEDKRILIEYVTKLKELDDKNRQIVDTIEHLRKPLSEISEADLAKARQLINDYVAELQTFPRDLTYRELRVTHNLYVDKASQAIELSGDKGAKCGARRATSISACVTSKSSPSGTTMA